MASYASGGLQTIAQDGSVPETRIKDASTTQDWVRRLIDNDSRRSWKRSRVNGLVDGNPPYKASKLRAAGRAEACNVNWGTGAAYLESASGAFYDLTAEAPSHITFRTSFGKSDEEKENFSNIASEEANKVFTDSDTWDYETQISQWDMVLHGCGPLFFEDAFQVFPRAVLCGDLKVPEFTKSDTAYFDGCFLQIQYFPPDLYEFIKDAESASKVGWDVEYTKTVIANAMDIRVQTGIQYDWEFYQQELKNNSLQYYDDTKMVWAAHVFWKEFDGRITHAIVERDTAAGKVIKYLYFNRGRYSSWQEAVHPMYYSHGNGGYHHSVTGLGVKMYSAMEYDNRLLCNLCDKAFSPKIIFKPTTAEMSQKFSLAKFGDYSVAPAGFDWAQTGVAGLMNDGIAMREELQQVMQTVLSSYRQTPPSQKSGNPVTKFEKQMEAAMQAALSMPQYNRYYKQLDMLYAEIWRRLTNPNTSNKIAKDFQQRCKDRGVPVEALCRPAYVGATRVIGQGSAFMRKQAIDALFPLAGALPEEGRSNLLKDKIAAEAGQAAVTRYYPQKNPSSMATDQQAEAIQWVAAMKVGVAPKMTSTQNPVTYAATFINAAMQSLKSLQAGANPVEVLQFLEIDGPAIAAYLKRFGQDPTRKNIHEEMVKQFKQLTSITDQLKQQVQKQQQQAQEQQQKTQSAMSDEQLKARKVLADIDIKRAKTAEQLKQSRAKHQMKLLQDTQDMAINDARAAADIHRSNLKSLQE